MKKFNEEQSQKVVGGAGEYQIDYRKLHQGKSVSKYELVVGQKYMCLSRFRHHSDIAGECLQTWEKPSSCGTVRTHKIKTFDGKVKEISGDDFNCFEWRD